MLRRLIAETCVVPIALAFANMAWPANPADSWPTFRGPDRTAVAPDTNLLTEWPNKGPSLVWEGAGAGRGYSSLAIADGRIYTMGDAPSTADDKDEYLLCFDLATGRQVWKVKIGDAWNDGDPSWQGSRSTPTVDADRIYAISPFGELICVDNRGKEVWRKHLNDDSDGRKADGWGYSESPLVDRHRLVCTPGGEANTIVALDKLTGDTIWSCSRVNDRGAGHASIVTATIGDARVYVQVTGSGVMGVRAADGKLLWTHDFDDSAAVIPTPIVRKDLVFFTTENRGGGLLRQIAVDRDEVDVEEVYPLQTPLQNKHGGVVLIGEYVYGDSNDRGLPYCAELMTGKVKWKGRGAGRGSVSVVAADGHIYFCYADGVMTLVEASPEAFREVGSFSIPGGGERPIWSHPVIVDGRLYLRNDDRLFCYELRE